MLDYLGVKAKAGDKIVYPVIRGGKLFLRDAQIARVLKTESEDKMEILVRRPGKKPFPTTYTSAGRFIIIKEGVVG